MIRFPGIRKNEKKMNATILTDGGVLGSVYVESFKKMI